MKGLLEEIRKISVYDQKTIVEKSCKLAEECGEVARSVLVHEKAHGSEYKGQKTEQDILEECCDVILVALSIPFKMGASQDKVIGSLANKLEKWKKVTK